MLGLLLYLVFRTLLLALTLTIFFLAVRRLLMSKSANAWLYAATALFALLTFLGLLPWVLGIGRSHPVFFVLAAAAPAIWYGVVTMCNATRHARYDSELERTVQRFAGLASLIAAKSPLILDKTLRADVPQPVFRHAPQRPAEPPATKRPLLLTNALPAQGTAARQRVSDATRTLLGIARGMRRNSSSEGRRPKLLPPPRKEDRNIPLLRTGESV